MTKEEKMQWWNSLTLQEKYEYYQGRIQEVKNKLYVDGKYEWKRNYYGDYPVYKYVAGLDGKERMRLEKLLRQLHNSRNDISFKIILSNE